jgi:hypothetical protein
VRQVADWLGHSDPSFTLRTYVHLMDEGIGDAEFMDEAVRGNTPSALQSRAYSPNEPMRPFRRPAPCRPIVVAADAWSSRRGRASS